MFACYCVRLHVYKYVCTRNGLGIKTGIDLDKLLDADIFISDALNQPTRSRTAMALIAKRKHQIKDGE